MRFIKVKTKSLVPPQDDIYKILRTSLPRLWEGDVIFITSKILAIHQGRCIKIDPQHVQKDRLIKKEADKYIQRRLAPYGNFYLTIKNSTLIPSAGIDESNGNGYYILWPRRVNSLLKELRDHLKKKFKLKNLAVVATDSHTIPLRYGVVGISIGSYGLEPLYDYRGKRDIFGRKLKYTKINIVDALSAMAVLLMGEGNEQIPIIVLRGAKFIKFSNTASHKKLAIPAQQDLYAPLLEVFKNKR